MRRTLRHRLLATVTIALAAVGLLAGCAADSPNTTTADVQKVDENAGGGSADSAGGAAAPEQGAYPPGSDAGTSSVTERSIVTTTSVSLISDDPAAVVSQLETMVAAKQGYFESREESGGERTRATLTIRIPADQHDAFIAELKPIAEVDAISTVEQDVTLTQLDLDARISTLESSVAALQDLLAKAADTTTMLDIEQTLTDRQAELQSLKVQRDALADDVAMSTVTVQITPQHVEVPDTDDRAPGFLAGLEHGWNAFLDAVAFLATMLGYLLPGLLLLALIAVPLVWFVRRRLRERRDAAGREPEAANDRLGARRERIGMPPLPTTPGFRQGPPPAGPTSAAPMAAEAAQPTALRTAPKPDPVDEAATPERADHDEDSTDQR